MRPRRKVDQPVSTDGKNGLSMLQALIAESYAVRDSPREPETGAVCVHYGCPRPGVPQTDGETACGHHAQYHGGPVEQWRPTPSGRIIR
jgi:hypothetical protein